MKLTPLTLRISLGAWTALAAGVGHAAPGFYVGAAQAFTQDSNLYRAARDAAAVADTISTTSLLAGADQSFGRQRILADLVLRHNRYGDTPALDNTGYDATGSLDWRAIERLSGKVSYATHRSLFVSGTDSGEPALTTNNQETSQDMAAGVRLGLDSLISGELGWRQRRLDESNAAFSALELRQNAVSAGLRYQPSDGLSLNAGGRSTRGKYPFAVQTDTGAFLADDFDRKDLDFSGVWVASGLSTLHARVSYTKESHERIPTRDFSGVTASLRWEYQPTAKLLLAADASRDTGAESTFYRISTGADFPATTSSGLSTTAQLEARYAATAKIQVLASMRQVRRNLVTTTATSSGLASAPAGSDRTSEFKLAVSYAPTRAWLLSCQAGQDSRTASSSLSYAYQARVGGCSVQFKVG